MEPKERLRFTMTCKCGSRVEVFQDSEDKRKFHLECNNCGHSDVLTRKDEEK